MDIREKLRKSELNVSFNKPYCTDLIPLTVTNMPQENEINRRKGV